MPAGSAVIAPPDAHDGPPASPLPRSFRYVGGSVVVLDVAVSFAASPTPPDERGTSAPAHATLVLTGDLCYLSSSTLALAFDTLVDNGVRAITVDLSHLELCTAAGVVVLQQVRRRLASTGGSLRLEGATGTVAKVLDICGLDHDLPAGTRPPADQNGGS